MLFFMVITEGGRRERNRQEPVDESLFIQIGENSREAFEELYLKTERTIYSYVLSILKNPQDTMDVVQDTYLKIRACAHLYQAQGKPLAWMFTIARNLAVSSLRACGKEVSGNDFLLEDDLGHSYIEDPTDRILLEKALKILNEQERTAVLLHVVSGMKHREIAADLGIPVATVLSSYHRALKKLRKYLEEGEAFL